jgi:hypothetical protein
MNHESCENEYIDNASAFLEPGRATRARNYVFLHGVMKSPHKGGSLGEAVIVTYSAVNQWIS